MERGSPCLALPFAKLGFCDRTVQMKLFYKAFLIQLRIRRNLIRAQCSSGQAKCHSCEWVKGERNAWMSAWKKWYMDGAMV